MSPFFSIITPVKNGRNFISRYIECLRNQTFIDWEAVIFDDGSNDNTYEIFLQNASNCSKFRIFKASKTKKLVNGPYQARNEALKKAKGDYILFFDIDDYWLPGKLAKYKKLIENRKIDLIVSSYLRVNASSKKFKIRDTNDFLIRSFIKIYNPIPNCTACIKRNLLIDTVFQPINHEDWKFWIDVLNKNKNIKLYTDKEINTFYFIHPSSITYSKLLSVKWIIKLYRFIGFNFLTIFFFLFIRMIIFIFIRLNEIYLSINFRFLNKEKYNSIKNIVNSINIY